ncbi:hypothetical protein M8C21_003367, partial [Ambrosia artemisiifolia]
MWKKNLAWDVDGSAFSSTPTDQLAGAKVDCSLEGSIPVIVEQ